MARGNPTVVHGRPLAISRKSPAFPRRIVQCPRRFLTLPTGVPSLEGSRPGVMTEEDMRTEPSFAVRGRGGVRTYTRKRRPAPPQ